MESSTFLTQKTNQEYVFLTHRFGPRLRLPPVIWKLPLQLFTSLPNWEHNISHYSLVHQFCNVFTSFFTAELTHAPFICSRTSINSLQLPNNTINLEIAKFICFNNQNYVHTQHYPQSLNWLGTI